VTEPGLAISVVDDEECVRKALERLLRAAGHKVNTFGSGKEFLASLATGQPDCTIVDLHLPGFSGLEVQQHLLRERIGIPCIIITGRDEVGVREQALGCGVAAYLTKPLDEDILLTTILSAVSKHHHSN
jgi:FixJ family two-component response regulator